MKGKTNNPNGRPKGVPNKATKDIRKWINNFLSDNLSQIQEDFKNLEPKDRVLLFEKLLKYSVPALQLTDITAVVNEENKLQKMSDEQLKARLKQLERIVK